MKFRKLGQALLAAVVSTGIMFGVTSCADDYTVGYVYVLGTQYNQIGQYREDNNNGVLAPIQGTVTPISSGGENPVRAIIPSGSRFMYVLNTGTKSVDGSGNITYSGSNISVFSIGGYGELTFQHSYFSQGYGPQRISADASGAHIFVLDEYAPIGIANNNIQTVSTSQSANFPCYEASTGYYRATGDVTVFAIDASTGRLTLVPNQQNTALTYFPVGCFPVDMYAGSYLYTLDAGSPSNSDVETIYNYAITSSTGQLTQTQNVPLKLPTNTSTSDPGVPLTPVGTSITGNGTSIYVLDAAGPFGFIDTYTAGTGGALTSINGGAYENTNSTAGDPQQLISIKGSSSTFIYLANYGNNTGTTTPKSDVSGYVINATTGQIQQPAFDSPTSLSSTGGVVSGAVCLFEDPSNQFVYIAGAADNSITGRKFDPQTGSLSPLNKATAFPVIGTPSWCLATTASGR
jgi:6-phosphogluconolactonase (cycloisomerase 2 family)